MIGMILIVTGILCSGLGILLLIRSNSILEKASFTKTDKIVNEIREHISTKETNKPELQKLIKLAVTDGVITGSEWEIIMNIAVETGEDLKKVEELMALELKKRDGKIETRLIDKDKENGTDFEAFIAKKFNPVFFSLNEWAGDKYSEGTYAESNTHPDLKFCFKLGKNEKEFAVECKYRSSFFKSGIMWAEKYQIDNYRKYEEKLLIPVFVAIGVGGKPDKPSDLFVIPLKDIEHPFLSKEFLNKYKMSNIHEKSFYFEPQELKLTLTKL